MTDEVQVRPYDGGDRDAVYDICLRTGDEGQDATRLTTVDLMGDVWVGPYLSVPGAVALVAVDAEGVAGYVVGAVDTRTFELVAGSSWWPAVRERHAAAPPPTGDPGTWSLDDRLRHLVHHPFSPPDDLVAGHPAHLHLNLLPRLQGRGVGRSLLAAAITDLADRGAPGVHVGVGPGNVRAQRFWRSGGFVPLRRDPGVDWLVRPVG